MQILKERSGARLNMRKNESEERKKWKNAYSQKKYGKSYDSLCCGRKKVVDDMYLVREK